MKASVDRFALIFLASSAPISSAADCHTGLGCGMCSYVSISGQSFVDDEV